MADLPALMRPGSMRVAWDRIIPQTNLTQDAIEGFASGNPELDHFWLDKSLTYSKIGMCAVHVAMKGEDIAGFYTISPSVIRGVGLPKSRQAGKPTMAHPSWLIGELAVRKDLRGKKENGSVGAALLCHAVHMACDLSVMAGGRLVMLDPLNDTLGKWYEDHGFPAATRREDHVHAVEERQKLYGTNRRTVLRVLIVESGDAGTAGLLTEAATKVHAARIPARPGRMDLPWESA